MFPFRKRSARRRAKLAKIGGFNEAFYLWKYPDVAALGIDPMRHYLEHGWREGRDPCESFSTQGYLAHNPDVDAAGVNPLVHFWESGLVEGRSGWQIDRG
ncbi:hypothetical protein MKK68_21205 [Methylobacterium sp. E-016]|jgi:hypothetical protein|uniref:hypothetical protein n=1 Tax=Methylobacterium sp. E-016 TaxID=2836556 RepID=UPI001FBBD05C|nr:hypothetical protein [Methylobacterium sp. E-016]MCJ2078132.1 hypothetical protein [Methylobacterium sp. E-016]